MVDPVFKIKEQKVTEEFGQFVIEPLDPGYGHTLGNALRRILMVSIPGAAVTSVKISGVKHRFSTIPGLKENVVDFLLNVKELNFRLLDSKSEATVKLSVNKGPKQIKASDLELPEGVEVINKDQYLGSLADKKSKLDMELTLEKGLGYSLAEERRVSTLGVIPTDAVFTPVRRVSFEVTATRVGRQTNLDKLTLNVWTNGVIKPREALDETAKILSSYFTQIYAPKEAPLEEASVSQGYPESVTKLTVDELDLPTRIYNSLRNGGIETLGDLLQTPRRDLIGMRNMGTKSIAVIEEKLKEKGISLTL